MQNTIYLECTAHLYGGAFDLVTSSLFQKNQKLFFYCFFKDNNGSLVKDVELYGIKQKYDEIPSILCFSETNGTRISHHTTKDLTPDWLPTGTPKRYT